jgi:hypothetical protein
MMAEPFGAIRRLSFACHNGLGICAGEVYERLAA